MITEITFPEELTKPLGLKKAEFRGLKPIVVLAGPNGAGKTRCLKLIHDNVNKLGKLLQQKSELEQQVKVRPESWNPPWNPAQAELEQVQFKLARFEAGVRFTRQPQEAKQSPKAISLSYSLLSGYGNDPHEMSPAAVTRVVDANKTGGFEQALQSVSAYFYDVAKAFYEAENTRFQGHPAIQQGLEDARAFNHFLRALLSAEIEPDLNDQRQVFARFRGRAFNPNELSKGELILAVWAIILHRQKEWLRGAYLLIDEPENHLHPDVCIRALNALQREILGPEGQIWLATHSVPLIAYAGIDSVHFVDNGSTEYAGNQIEKVLDRLLGGEEGRSKLKALLADAEEIAFDAFAAQCLLPPGVVSAREGDPQQKQMVLAAQALGAGKEIVHILDFAAGRGRLAAALKSAATKTDRRFTYFAFQDPSFKSEEDQRECLEYIRGLGQPGAPETYLVEELERFTVRDAKRMDLVVMCNVLHEIPVGDWQRSFASLHDVLAEDGHLVILEDQQPSVGELPHAHGYVILHEPALQHLFDSKDAVIRLPSEKGDRLTAFAVPRAFLKKVTPQTLGRALASVKRLAEDRIRRIRATLAKQRTFQDGRLHAHFTLLYANAQLASREFPDPDA